MNNSNENKFERRGKRSISLIQKKKMGSQVFKEELKLKVLLNTIIEENSGLPAQKYKVISKLGDGSYGTVYLAVNIITKQNVAMKKINKVKENEIDDMEIKNEIEILKKLDHPNIVKIIEFYSTPKAYYIITDFCACGELYNQIKHQYTEGQLAVLFYQVFSGLYYLHTKNIVHRDLKLENILISEIEKDNNTNEKYFWVKIIDFGTAKIFEKNKNEKAVVGSSYYIAPEVLHKNYNEKCDTWSVGVILYMLIVGRAPFDGQNDEEIIENIEKGEFNSKHKKLLNSSAEVQDLVKKLLEVNVKKRLSSSEALKHPWFKKFNGKSLYSNIDKETVMIYLNRLRKFEINSKFQQMVLAFIVHNIPNNNESKDILKIFRMFNTNDDGKLTKKELLDGLIKYFNEKEIKKEIDDIFLLLDGANRGFIEYEEFLRATLEQKTLLSNENLTYAFNFFDGDGCGKISVEKIKKFFVNDKVSEDVFRNIFNEIDSNGDGEIDYDEFKDMMFGN
jgi:calcium-dependent protein kinase